MVRMTLIISILLFTLRLSAPGDSRAVIIQPEAIQPYEAIWNAVCKVESNNDPFVIGDKHLRQYSYGVAQIRQIRLDDYYDRTGIQYTTKEMFDPVKSKEVFMYFMMQYNDTDLAVRRWNGQGIRTYAYLNKVKKHL